MNEPDSTSLGHTSSQGVMSIAVNIFASPSEAFEEIRKRPRKLFPIVLVMLSMAAVMGWYYAIVDFDWFMDDALAGANLDEQQLEQARENMQNMSPTMFRVFGMVGGPISIMVIWLLQAGYLSLVSALNGDQYRFTHWFSLVAWTSLPSLLSFLGMAVTIALNTTGQLSAYDLDPTTLRNLGITSSNGSVERLMTSINLTMLWGVILTVLGYRQWLDAGWARTLGVVLAPYLLILGVWAFFALS